MTIKYRTERVHSGRYDVYITDERGEWPQRVGCIIGGRNNWIAESGSEILGGYASKKAALQAIMDHRQVKTANGQGVTVTVQQPVRTPALFEQTYGHLHDMLSDMIESGRLTAADIPDDYEALVEHLAEVCVPAGPRIKKVVNAFSGLCNAVNKLLQPLDNALARGDTLTSEEEDARQFALAQLAALEPMNQDEQQRLTAGLHAACDYLNKDRRWHMDAGKLQTVLKQSGLRVMPL